MFLETIKDFVKLKNAAEREKQTLRRIDLNAPAQQAFYQFCKQALVTATAQKRKTSKWRKLIKQMDEEIVQAVKKRDETWEVEEKQEAKQEQEIKKEQEEAQEKAHQAHQVQQELPEVIAEPEGELKENGLEDLAQNIKDNLEDLAHFVECEARSFTPQADAFKKLPVPALRPKNDDLTQEERPLGPKYH